MLACNESLINKYTNICIKDHFKVKIVSKFLIGKMRLLQQACHEI